MLSYAGAVFRALALALFAASLVVGFGLAVYNSGQRLIGAVAYWGVDAAASRRRVMREAWVDAVEEIRRAVPRDGEYFLVNGDGPRGGGHYFVRYELAPRRARYLGYLGDIVDPAKTAAAMPPGPRWVVITVPKDEPPLLLDRDEFLRQLAEEAHGTR